MGDFQKKRGGAEERPWRCDIHDLDTAEAAVVGAALLSPDSTLATMARWGVRPEWFRMPSGRLFCEALFALRDEGSPIDLVTATDWCERRGHPEAAAVLEKLVDATPTAGHGPFYVGMMAERWTERAIRDACAETVRVLDRGDTQTATVLSQHVDRMVRLVEAGRAGSEPTAFETMTQVIDAWAKARDEGRSLGIPWPFREMNDLSGGIFPGLNIVAARPSVGKSMMEGLVSRTFLMAGLKVARVCLDMTRQKIISRDLCAAAGESVSKMDSGYMTRSDEAKLRLVAEACRGWRETVIEDRTAEGVVARARGLWANGGLDILTVDYAQLLSVDDTGRRYENDNQRIGRAVSILKLFSNSTGVPVLLLSQLGRDTEKEGRRPQLSDLRDSGSLEQEAATVSFLYMEPRVGKAWCDAQGATDWKELAIRPVVWDLLKNQQGRTGRVYLRQSGSYMRFEPARRIDFKAGERASSPDNLVGGWDLGQPADPDPKTRAGEYVVCRHPKGAVEALEAPWFERVNEAAARLGQEGYRELRRAVGVAAAMAALERERAAVREENHLRDFDAMADADADRADLTVPRHDAGQNQGDTKR